jgi:hypothetical protein
MAKFYKKGLDYPSLKIKTCCNQGCGSGSGLALDSVTLWIRIHIGNPDPGSGSRGKKIKEFQWKNALFSYFLKSFTTKKALTTFF